MFIWCHYCNEYSWTLAVDRQSEDRYYPSYYASESLPHGQFPHTRSIEPYATITHHERLRSKIPEDGKILITFAVRIKERFKIAPDSVLIYFHIIHLDFQFKFI